MKLSTSTLLLALPSFASAVSIRRGNLRSLATTDTKQTWPLDPTEGSPITFDEIDSSCLNVIYDTCVYADRQPFFLASPADDSSDQPENSRCPILAFHQDASGPVMIPVTPNEYHSIKNSMFDLKASFPLSEIKTVFDKAPLIQSFNADGSPNVPKLFVTAGSFFTNMLRNLDIPMTVNVVNYIVDNMVKSNDAYYARKQKPAMVALGLNLTDKELQDDHFLISALVWYVILNYVW